MGDLLLGNVVRAGRGRTGSRPAVSHRGRTITYSQLADDAERLARVLAHRGVGPGSRVAWSGDTGVDAVALYFGLGMLGAVFVPVNPAFSEAEAAPLLELADPDLVLTDRDHPGDAVLADLVAESAPEDGPGGGGPGGGVPGGRSGGRTAVDERDPHVMLFTSGTTGRPKGVLLSHRTEILRALVNASASFPLGPTVCMFPQFHMAGWAAPLSAWISGEEVVYVDGGEPEALLGAVERHRARRLYCIPAVWGRILDVLDEDPRRFDTSSLLHADTGTSATTPGLLRRIRAAFPGTTTTISYGSTEAGLVARLWPDDVERKPGSVGPPAAGVELRIEDGELLVHSPYLMTGYFRDPGATERALAGGWYHTGELAEVDEEGYYRVTGRVSDLIRTGGESVSPVEVDGVLQTHPAVADVAVAGVPDDDWGEVVTAFVVLRSGCTVDLGELRAHCQGRLAPYKHPRRLVVVEAIPRTPSTGQPQRRRLAGRPA